MAKTYIESVKYIIHSDFEISGVVDKPDIIGAVFGQSEGLLGEELDLRELQKNGRIGRIEITSASVMGKTRGVLTVPSSMDMVETCILAAAIETVEKVGPFESRFRTKAVQDTRSAKRKEVVDRAKQLLQEMQSEQIPDRQEIAQQVRDESKTAEVVEWGPEKLAAGPSVKEDPELIVVEGRADVLNLLRNNIKNVISMGGSKPSQSLVELCRRKKVTLFIDGDRGGELNLRKLIEMTPIAFVARAPDGKEVEELTRKEIVMSLRRRMPSGYAMQAMRNHEPIIPDEPPVVSDALPSLELSPEMANDSNVEQIKAEMRKIMDVVQPRTRSPEPVERENVRSGTSMMMNRPQPTFSSPVGPRSFGSEMPRSNGERKFPIHLPGDEKPFTAPVMNKPFEKKIPTPAPLPKPMQSVAVKPIAAPKENSEDKELREKLTIQLKELKGSLKARLLDEKNKVVIEVPVRDLLKKMSEAKPKAKKMVFDGIITKRLVEECEKNGIHTIMGIKKAKMDEVKSVKSWALNN